MPNESCTRQSLGKALRSGAMPQAPAVSLTQKFLLICIWILPRNRVVRALEVAREHMRQLSDYEDGR